MAEGVARGPDTRPTSIGQMMGELTKGFKGVDSSIKFGDTEISLKGVSPQIRDYMIDFVDKMHGVQHTINRTGAILPLSDEIYAHIREAQGMSAGGPGVSKEEMKALKQSLGIFGISADPKVADFGWFSPRKMKVR